MTETLEQHSRNYTARNLDALEGLEAVRMRPSMYIGGVDKTGLHHLVWEIVDNAVDEHINGYADTVTVTLHKSGHAITVTDNGRGIPVDKHPKHKIPGVQLILTMLHAGGKFNEENYLTSGGLHGVGSSVVNALSRKLIVTIRRDGHEWQQNYKRGKPTSELEKLRSFRGHGTTIYFEPDPDIFKTTDFDPNMIRARLEDTGYIHSGLKLIFKNEITGEDHDLTHEGGIPEYLYKLVKETQKEAITEQAFHIARNNGERLEVALQWTESTDVLIRSYANGIRTHDGGRHETGFKSAIVSAIRNYIDTHDVKVKDVEITANDIREGVVGILSVFLRNPEFQGQTKDKLNNPEMTSTVESFVRPGLETWLNNNRSAAEEIVGRIIMAARARMASREAAKEVKRKSVTQRKLNLPGKLADCKSTSLNESELFIVEGDSAGGSAKQGRNNKTQAILPLRGKVKNAEGLPTLKALENAELRDLISALGTGAGQKFDYGGLRYGKIILLMDADPDGHHISTLLLGFFFRHLPELIRKGHVYVAQPPLYKIEVGKDTHWARDDNHKEEILAGLRANAKAKVGRFKGLGEMNAKELSETTLDVRKRTLLQVKIDSPLEVDQTFVRLLGNDASLRHDFIEERATQVAVEDLDSQ